MQGALYKESNQAHDNKVLKQVKIVSRLLIDRMVIGRQFDSLDISKPSQGGEVMGRVNMLEYEIGGTFKVFQGFAEQITGNYIFNTQSVIPLISWFNRPALLQKTEWNDEQNPSPSSIFCFRRHPKRPGGLWTGGNGYTRPYLAAPFRLR
jgi:hypothetical protein